MVAAAAPSEGPQDTVRTRRLEIVDAQGRPRIRLRCVAGEHPMIEIVDWHGSQQVSIDIGSDDGRPALMLSHEGNPQVMIGIGDGGPYATLQDDSGVVAELRPTRAEDEEGTGE